TVRIAAAPLRDAAGNILGVVTSGELVGPAHEEATAPLREQEARLRTILETVPDAIIVIDDQALIQSFSSAAERQFGYRAEEVIGRNVNMLTPQPDRNEHDAYIHRYQHTHDRRII